MPRARGDRDPRASSGTPSPSPSPSPPPPPPRVGTSGADSSSSSPDASSASRAGTSSTDDGRRPSPSSPSAPIAEVTTRAPDAGLYEAAAVRIPSSRGDEREACLAPPSPQRSSWANGFVRRVQGRGRHRSARDALVLLVSYLLHYVFRRGAARPPASPRLSPHAFSSHFSSSTSHLLNASFGFSPQCHLASGPSAFATSSGTRRHFPHVSHAIHSSAAAEFEPTR